MSRVEPSGPTSAAPARAPSLAELQRRLAGLITGDPPVDEAARRERRLAAEALGVVGDDRLDAEGRAGIYAGMWFARIHDAVAEDYPATRSALGASGFETMLRGYLAEHPPRDPSLRHAGDHLADHLGRRPGDPRPDWVAELAAFEHAITVAFDAREQPLLRAATLAALPPEEWPKLAIRFVASLVVLRPRHCVDEIRDRLLAGEDTEALSPPPAGLFVWRQEERVFHRRADAVEAALVLAAVSQGGLSFEALCEVAATGLEGTRSAGSGDASDAPDPAAFVLARLESWLRDGLLADVPVPG